ncbi:MAG TPA: hypothetical protein DD806_06540 [Flavobacterium sp.]|nr:hypothetical protein [Flavobacterium sp.]
MSVFVVNCESVESTEVVGVYPNEKLAKAAAGEYVDTWYGDGGMKKKQVKKDSDYSRKVLFKEDTKENPAVITMTETSFDMPKGKGKKEKKDPLAPKKGMSSYMFFFKENREKIKSQNPDAEFGEIGKLIGAAWKSLDEDQKAVYEEMSQQDKKRYKNDMAEYEGGESEEKPKKKAAPKKTKKVVEEVEEDEEEIEEVEVKPKKSSKASKA